MTTSVDGTLGISTTGNITALAGGYFVGDGSYITNVPVSGPIVSTSISSGGTGIAGTITGQWSAAAGSALVATSVAGANVTGAVAFATTANSVAGANVSGQVANALVAGTVYTAAQPNITSVGTLTALAVSGALTTTQITTGATGTAGNITGQWTLAAGSTLQATYADLGERYASDEQYEPGTVVMIGGVSDVTIATRDGSTRIAGIVSTNPAYILNSMMPDSVILALTGRVPCKVVGKINKGDMLTVSEINGVATAVSGTPQYGTIIARALEAYDSSEVGVIEVKVDRG